jgi:FixJ family two-component response regulator
MSTRILLVDDDKALLDALPEALQLRMNGIQIDTSETAIEALERIRDTDYDAIVSDIKMPGMDGLALLHEIRELRPTTPTLMITGHGERDLAVQALRGGAYDFVQKPIDRDYFVASLERAIQLRRLDREVEQQRLALERHARVLEHVNDGVFLIDDGGVIRHWNPAARAITGVPADQVLERNAAEVLPGWHARADDPDLADARNLSRGREDGPDRPRWTRGLDLVTESSSVARCTHSGASAANVRSRPEDEFVTVVSHELKTPSLPSGAAGDASLTEARLDERQREPLFDMIATEPIGWHGSSTTSC